MLSILRSRWILPVLVAAGLVAGGWIPSGLLAQQAPATKAKAAEKPPTAPPTAPPAADPSKPAKAAYDKLFEDWKTVLKDLRKLRVQYQSAEEADQPKITESWNALVAKGNDLLAQLQVAGVKAYDESPNEDPQLARFLAKMAADDIAHDDYPTAKSIADALIAGQSSETSIYDAAAISSLMLNDYDKAEEYFKKAQEAGVLSKYGQELVGFVPEYKELWAAEQKIREAEAAKDDLPRVKLTTTKGDIVLELFEDQAPETVGNFISLVEKKDEAGKGFYDGLAFHRVLRNFMAQGGDPKGNGTGGPGYTIYCESDKEGYRKHFAGSLSMAHSGRDTGGSQFFLTFRPTPHLNAGHTCFGRVIEGMDVLTSLQERDPENPKLVEPDKIIKAEVVRKRDHPYVPRKVE